MAAAFSLFITGLSYCRFAKKDERTTPFDARQVWTAAVMYLLDSSPVPMTKYGFPLLFPYLLAIWTLLRCVRMTEKVRNRF